jgi:hypothetical protein
VHSILGKLGLERREQIAVIRDVPLSPDTDHPPGGGGVDEQSPPSASTDPP